MKSTNLTLLSILNVLSWIIFIGLCIKTGAMLFSLFFSLLFSTAGDGRFYGALDLNELYAYSPLQYFFTAASLIAVTALKAYIAYLVVQIFLKFDLASPFNPELTALIARISRYALLAGVVALFAGTHNRWLEKRGIESVGDWGAGEILFFAGVLYILAEVYKKGVELQLENDLTV